MKRPTKPLKIKSFEDDDYAVNNSEETIKLYGKWQLEPLQLPHAVNGIVPKVLFCPRTLLLHQNYQVVWEKYKFHFILHFL